MADSMDWGTFEQNIFLNVNSQNESAVDPEVERREKRIRELQKKDQEDKEKGELKAVRSRIELERQAAADIEALKQYELEKRDRYHIERLRKQLEEASSIEEANELELELKKAELQKKRDDEIIAKYKQASQEIASSVNNTLNGTFNEIRKVTTEYSDYVEKIQVGLIGTQSNYNSVVDNLSKVFSLNVFFSLDSAIKKSSEMIEKGITYNVELRSALDVMSDKIARTFDAFDASLLRLIKIQQEDSTKARLGMESFLLTYMNKNFQDSQYLQGLSDQVTAALLEASSTKSTSDSVEFEYAVQKYLGSFSSLGVSDSTIQAFAQALGYLGSGDVSSLTGNSALQQLIALSIERGKGNRSYGDMLLEGVEVSDVIQIFEGFYDLVKEIKNSDNLVAMNQYAKIFGLTMSDITSVMNITDEQLAKISEDMKSYQQARDQVDSEMGLGNLMKRTSASQMYNNIKKNLLSSIGLDFANDLAMNLLLEGVDQAASIVDMVTLGVEIDPFGVGSSAKIDNGALIRGAVASGIYGVEFLKNIKALSSLVSPNLKYLGDSENSKIEIMRGGLTETSDNGLNQNQNLMSFIGNTENSSIYDLVNQRGKEITSEVTGKDIDAEEERMEEILNDIKGISDSASMILQVLNIDGIRVREVSQDGSFSGSIATKQNSSTNRFMGGGY